MFKETRLTIQENCRKPTLFYMRNDIELCKIQTVSINGHKLYFAIHFSRFKSVN